jgi:hypothetical protein
MVMLLGEDLGKSILIKLSRFKRNAKSRAVETREREKFDDGRRNKRCLGS